MDQDECPNHEKQPSVEVFIATAAKQDELL